MQFSSGLFFAQIEKEYCLLFANLTFAIAYYDHF